MNFDIQGVLFPNVLTMAVQLCSTLVLFLLCKKLLWKPAREILKARQDKMNATLKDAEKIRDEANASFDEAKKYLDDARNKSGEIVESARNEANELKNAIVSDARREAQEKLDNAERQIDKYRETVENDLHDEIVDVAMAAVSKLLEEKANSAADNEALERYVEEVRKK